MLLKLILISTIIGSTLVCFQNCSNLNQDYASTIQVSCNPSTKPCLHYKLKVTNLKSSFNSMGILVQGDVNEGVRDNTDFTGDCKKVNPSYAQCAFETVVKATIKSDSTTTTAKGDGRTLTLSVPTTTSVESYNRSSYSKMHLIDAPAEELCFETPEGKEVYNGELISDFNPVPCSQE